MFVSEARSLPLSGVSKGRVGPSLYHKLWARLERLAIHKQSSLLQNLVDYYPKKFYNIAPRASLMKRESLKKILD